MFKGYKIGFLYNQYQDKKLSVNFDSVIEKLKCKKARRALFDKRAVKRCQPEKKEFLCHPAGKHLSQMAHSGLFKI